MQFRELVKSGLDAILNAVDRKRAAELVRRNRQRSPDKRAWLLAEEEELLRALASQILPSDETGPGAAEANVVARLDALLLASPARQELYARGLLSVDRWAQRKRGMPFLRLMPDEQTELLRLIEEKGRAWSEPASSARKGARKLDVVYFKFVGLHDSVALFPRLVRDVMQEFYTSEVAWAWLGYDGPPMPLGYAFLTEPRPPVANQAPSGAGA